MSTPCHGARVFLDWADAVPGAVSPARDTVIPPTRSCGRHLIVLLSDAQFDHVVLAERVGRLSDELLVDAIGLRGFLR